MQLDEAAGRIGRLWTDSITGVLGPKSNAHGPNEFLHLKYAEDLTTVVASVLADHAKRE